MEPSTHGSSIKRTDHQHKIWDLRVQGLSIREIGKRLNISHVAVLKAIAQTWEEMKDGTHELAGAYREIEIERLDNLRRELLEELMENLKRSDSYQAGDPKAITAAVSVVNQCVRISDQRARMLGLYAPTTSTQQVQVSLEKELDSILDALESRLPEESFKEVLNILSEGK